IAACTVSMDYRDSVRTLEVSDMGACILPFVGIHPERVAGPDVEDALRDTAVLAEQNADRIAGIGEIGLDPTYAGDGRIPPVQVRAFEHMLELASQKEPRARI
ncbi:MAG: TatD family hydrolase, partial [Nitrosopumilaceae archaeon]|nr:TatD family hydrolase [Nitrosopumilaceae archaeon]